MESITILVYASSAVALLGREQLLALMEQARADNAARHITGMLLYKDGNFLEVLEGPKDEVERTFHRISRDRRHQDVMVLLKEERTGRTFSDWSMAFYDRQIKKRGEELEIPGFSTFLHEPLSPEYLGARSSSAQRLIASFHQNM